MVNISHFLSKSFMALSLFSSFSLKAIDLESLNQNIKSNYKKKVTLVDYDNDFSFETNPTNLLNSALEVSSVKMSKEEFQNSDFVKFDIDHINKSMSDQDFMTITKTYFLFPNQKPSFFSLKRINSEGYCKAAFNDKKRTRVDKVTVYSENIRHTVPINVTVNFMVYNLKKDKLKGGSREELEKVLALAPLGLKNLEQVVTTYSNHKEISFGSTGARTSNYYYNIGGKHTLHSSIKVLSFKKESFYSKGLAKAINAWKKINDGAVKGQKTGTRDSFQRLTKYIYKTLQKS